MSGLPFERFVRGATKMKKLLIVSVVILLTLLLGLTSCIPVAITQPIIVTFEVSPSSVNAGQPATLIWAVTYANSVTIDHGIGSVALSGSRQVTPSNTTAYTITASNNFGTASRSVVLNVIPVVIPVITINQFQAEPSTITAGASTTLQWTVTGANSVTIDQGIGAVALSGNRVIFPESTTTYTLTASNGNQSTSSTITVNVTNPPVIARFSTFPEVIEFGRTSLLRWNVTGASRVVIEPDIGVVPSAGNHAVTPNTTTIYTLTAESSCCVVTRQVVVTVTGFGFPSPGLPTIFLLNITPDSIYKGGSATLEWQVSGATSVVIDHGIGQVPPNGSIAVYPESSTFYTLTAVNEFGARQASVGIVVFVP